MKILKYAALFLITFITSEAILGQEYVPEEYLKYGAEKLNNRGLVNSGSIFMADNESIGEYDGNLMLTYGLSTPLQNGLSVNMSLIFNSNVEHCVFFETHREIGSGGYSVNVPTWIIGINGFAVQTTNFENNLYSMDSVGNTGWDTKPLTGTNLALLTRGYHFTNKMNYSVFNNGLYAMDFIQILMADGSVKVLAQTSEFDSVYAESNKTNYSYAIVRGRVEDLRKMWYKPGDGLTYYFEEENVNYNDSDDMLADPKIMYLKEIIASNGAKLIINYANAPCLETATRYGRKVFSGVYYKSNSSSTAQYVCSGEPGSSSYSNSYDYLSLSNGVQYIYCNFVNGIIHTTNRTGNPGVSKIGYLRDIISKTDEDDFNFLEDTVKINYVSDKHRNRNYRYSLKLTDENYDPLQYFYFYFPINLVDNIIYPTGRKTQFNYYDIQFDGSPYPAAVDFHSALYVGNTINRNLTLRDNQTNYMIYKRTAYVDSSKTWDDPKMIWMENYTYSFLDDSWLEAVVEGITTSIEKRNYIDGASNYSPSYLLTSVVFNKYNIDEYLDGFFDRYYSPGAPSGYGSMTKLISKTVEDGSFRTTEEYLYDIDSLEHPTIVCKYYTTWLLEKKIETVYNKTENKTSTKATYYKYDFTPVAHNNKTRDRILRRKIIEPQGLITETTYNDSYFAISSALDYYSLNSIKTEKQYSGHDTAYSKEYLYYSKTDLEGEGRLKGIRAHDAKQWQRYASTNYTYYNDNSIKKGFIKEIILNNGLKTKYTYLETNKGQPIKVVKYDGSSYMTNEHIGAESGNWKYMQLVSQPYIIESILGQDTLREFHSEIYNEKQILEIDLNGLCHIYTYNLQNKIKNVSNPGSFGVRPDEFSAINKYYSATYDYRSDSNNIIATSHFTTTPGAITKRVEITEYDAYGNPKRTYVNGELKQETRYTFLKQPYYQEDGEHRVTKAKYDYLSRPLRIINNDGTTKNFNYDLGSGYIDGVKYFNSTKQIDEKNNYKTTYYDSLGNVIAETMNGVLKTFFKYNKINQLVEVTTPNNKKTTYGYDGFGNLSSKTSPDEGQWYYKYDKFGNLRFKYQYISSSLTPLTYYLYDPLNRLIAVGVVNDFFIDDFDALDPDIINTVPFNENSQSNWVVKNMYDKYSRTGNFADAPDISISDGNFKGRLATTGFRDKTANTWSYKVYDYDELGRVDRLIQKFDIYTALRTITNKYDHLGNLTYQNIDGQYYIWYKYDVQGRLIKCLSNFFNIESTASTDARYTYNLADQIRGKATLNGASKIDSITYTYNNMGWLSNILRNGGSFQQSLTYETNGNIKTQGITNTASSWPNLSFTYGYDSYDRLISSVCSNAAYSETFTYNNDGAITSKVRSGLNIGYVYPTTSNKLSSITVNGTGYAFSYDAKGNFLSNAYRKVYLSNYDHRNLPLSESAQTAGSTLYYDDNGNRIGKLYSSMGGAVNKEYYLRDHTGREIAIYDLVTGKIKFVNLYGIGLIGRAEIY